VLFQVFCVDDFGYKWSIEITFLSVSIFYLSNRRKIENLLVSWVFELSALNVCGFIELPQLVKSKVTMIPKAI
jgi:hypothetical protein